MVAALQSLKRDYGMVNVDNFVITGGSAGGLSTFIHTDELGALAGARATVGMPDASKYPNCIAFPPGLPVGGVGVSHLTSRISHLASRLCNTAELRRTCSMLTGRDPWIACRNYGAIV